MTPEAGEMLALAALSSGKGALVTAEPLVLSGATMNSEVLVAVIAAGPPTLAAVLSYVASKRSLRRSLGNDPGVPLREVLAEMERRFETRFDRVESKLDRVAEDHLLIRERLGLLEADTAADPWGRLQDGGAGDES
jgi:hypothetical protein